MNTATRQETRLGDSESRLPVVEVGKRKSCARCGDDLTGKGCMVLTLDTRTRTYTSVVIPRAAEGGDFVFDHSCARIVQQADREARATLNTLRFKLDSEALS